ncbi:hypothetical protein [Polynucleobacter sp. TUM22923]|uniref:hypothetical protein n=1 Tax=Polynucleobacter sp. TUM22923 TaxID=3022126 RepID=UPI002573129A|nr:hypothetical protein [Polynucleobacter sp. TUM22923]
MSILSAPCADSRTLSKPFVRIYYPTPASSVVIIKNKHFASIAVRYWQKINSITTSAAENAALP